MRKLIQVAAVVALALSLQACSADTPPTHPQSQPVPILTPADGYAGQWNYLTVNEAFAKANLAKTERFVHYQGCVPTNAKELLWEGKLWQACPTDSLITKVSNGKILWSVGNTPHPAIDVWVSKDKHAGRDQRVVNFKFNYNLQVFGIFMKPEGGPWMFINSPATSVVVNKYVAVEFFVMASSAYPNFDIPATYPRDFSPLAMRLVNEWPDSPDCVRMSGTSYINGQPAQMGGSSAPLRTYTMVQQVNGATMTFAFNFGPSRPFATWITIGDSWHLVKNNTITVPTSGTVAVVTYFDNPEVCGFNPNMQMDVAKLKATGQWPSLH